eukprot:scaffold7063_cov103-Isochrysis_galbana.AAC.1
MLLLRLGAPTPSAPGSAVAACRRGRALESALCRALEAAPHRRTRTRRCRLAAGRPVGGER